MGVISPVVDSSLVVVFLVLRFDGVSWIAFEMRACACVERKEMSRGRGPNSTRSPSRQVFQLPVPSVTTPCEVLHQNDGIADATPSVTHEHSDEMEAVCQTFPKSCEEMKDWEEEDCQSHSAISIGIVLVYIWEALLLKGGHFIGF